MRLFSVHALDDAGAPCASDGLVRAGTLYEARSLAKRRFDDAPVVEIWEDGRCVVRLDRKTHLARLARLERGRADRHRGRQALA